MAFNIYTFSNSIKNLVNKNNTVTSTYDISNGLEKRVQTVALSFYNKKPVLNINYPAVFVTPRVKSDEHADMRAGSANRNMEINMEVTGIVHEGMGAFDGREISDEQMLKLSANVETLFRNYIDLSNSSQVLHSLMTSTEYDVVESEDTYNSIFKIDLRVSVRSN